MKDLNSTISVFTRVIFSLVILVSVVYSSTQIFVAADADINLELVDTEEGDTETNGKLKEVEVMPSKSVDVLLISSREANEMCLSKRYFENDFISPDIEQATPPPDQKA